jgi:hypothetical protein
VKAKYWTPALAERSSWVPSPTTANGRAQGSIVRLSQRLGTTIARSRDLIGECASAGENASVIRLCVYTFPDQFMGIITITRVDVPFYPLFGDNTL